jgi:hypothetical protein
MAKELEVLSPFGLVPVAVVLEREMDTVGIEAVDECELEGRPRAGPTNEAAVGAVSV